MIFKKNLRKKKRREGSMGKGTKLTLMKMICQRMKLLTRKSL